MRCCERERCKRSRPVTPAAAIGFATRLVGADPLNEDAHVLLVRSFAAAGDETAVQEQLDDLPGALPR